MPIKKKKIKRIPVSDIDQFCSIASNAYPAMGCHAEPEMIRMQEKVIADNRFKNISTWGAYEEDRLVGGLRLFDFWGTLFETRILYGGGGFLAVDLTQKKKRIARDLMLHFLRHFRKLDSPIAVLYPFRPDFYRQMGFGYGAKVSEYMFNPADLPKSAGKDHMKLLSAKDTKRMIACHDLLVPKTHGMIQKSGHELAKWKNPANRLVGYVRGNRLEGYMVLSFRRMDEDNFLANDIVVSEMIYERPEVLAEFMSFLNSQADQVRRIRFNSSDDFLHFLPVDPRDDSDAFVGPIAHQTNRQGIGLMYRVINLPALISQLKGHNFSNENLLLSLRLIDSFLPENDGEYLIEFKNGRPRMRQRGEASIRIEMKVEEFSSMLMGTIPFYSLYDFGLAKISKRSEVGRISKLFSVPRPPVCLTQF